MAGKMRSTPRRESSFGSPHRMVGEVGFTCALDRAEVIFPNFKTTHDSSRVPGMHHCGGDPGPNLSDSVTRVIDWEPFIANTPPDMILATYCVNNDPTWVSIALCHCARIRKWRSTSVVRWTSGPAGRAQIHGRLKVRSSSGRIRHSPCHRRLLRSLR
jgi:hypothetical protein